MPVPLYTPSNFAMIAGDEMSASNNIPVAFGYYAEFAEVGDIMNLTASTGSLFFGLRRDGSGTPLTGTEKQQPSATLLLPRGTIILINGNNLVDLMHQYNVGIQVRNIYKIKEVDEDFFEEN